MTTPISSTSQTDINSLMMNPKTTAPPDNSMGKDAFLKLLVAQLKYQNPLSPTDPSQFMAQTASFTMVEKLQDMEKESTDMLQAQRVATASSMLGQKVTATGSDGNVVTGVVTGVHIQSDGPILRLGSVEIPLSSVTEVSPAK